MKTLFLIACLGAGARGMSQGTFIFDQQSSTYEAPLAYGSGSELNALLPYTGQSFTPTLPEIDFIRLKFQDGGTGDGVGATIYLNLRSGSISGTILGSTAPVSMPNGFTGVTNFFFPSTISLTPETTYFFELVVQSAQIWDVDIESFNYTGGEAFAQGTPRPGADYWFREGLYVVPEPSGFALGLLGGGLFTLARKRR